MLRVAVVGSVTTGAGFLVADDVFRLDSRIILHEPLAEVSCKPEGILEVGAVVQRVLGYLYLNVRRAVIVAAF